MDQHKWDQRFLALAKFVSTWSKDPSTKVGSVIAAEKQIVSMGFNGFPPGMVDDLELLNNREEKYKRIRHAEDNAMEFAYEALHDQRWSVPMTLYSYPLMPCYVCADKIRITDIKRVVSVVNENPRWQDSFLLAKNTFKDNNIELVLYENLIEEV